MKRLYFLFLILATLLFLNFKSVKAAEIPGGGEPVCGWIYQCTGGWERVPIPGSPFNMECQGYSWVYYGACPGVSTPAPTAGGGGGGSEPPAGSSCWCTGTSASDRGECPASGSYSYPASGCGSLGQCCIAAGGGGGGGEPPPPPPPPVPTCSITLTPNPATVVMGIPGLLAATVTQNDGTVTSVTFSSNNPAVVSASSPDDASPFTSNLTGVSEGTAVITAGAGINGAGGSSFCSATATVNVVPPPPWWQVQGDSMSGVHITSPIPPSCVLPTCVPNFSKDDTNSYPGITIYGNPGTYDFLYGVPTGTASSRGWLSQYNRNAFAIDSTIFNKLVLSTTQFNAVSGTVNGSALASGGITDSKGYTWYSANGNLTIIGNMLLPANRKVILFVNNGNLALQGRINFTDSSNFFMVIVGRGVGGSNGNIFIDPGVTSPANSYALEGVYFADNAFYTGTLGVGLTDFPLRVRGSVSASNIQLQRNLRGGNVNTPAEYFEFAEEILINYPSPLMIKHLIWQEVAP